MCKNFARCHQPSADLCLGYTHTSFQPVFRSGGKEKVIVCEKKMRTECKCALVYISNLFAMHIYFISNTFLHKYPHAELLFGYKVLLCCIVGYVTNH